MTQLSEHLVSRDGSGAKSVPPPVPKVGKSLDGKDDQRLAPQCGQACNQIVPSGAHLKSRVPRRYISPITRTVYGVDLSTCSAARTRGIFARPAAGQRTRQRYAVSAGEVAKTRLRIMAWQKAADCPNNGLSTSGQ